MAASVVLAARPMSLMNLQMRKIIDGKKQKF